MKYSRKKFIFLRKNLTQQAYCISNCIATCLCFYSKQPLQRKLLAQQAYPYNAKALVLLLQSNYIARHLHKAIACAASVSYILAVLAQQAITLQRPGLRSKHYITKEPACEASYYNSMVLAKQAIQYKGLCFACKAFTKDLLAKQANTIHWAPIVGWCLRSKQYFTKWAAACESKPIAHYWPTRCPLGTLGPIRHIRPRSGQY